MAPIIYKPEAEELQKLLWVEMMEEFAPFGVEDILREVSQA